jgi:3',5'-cyclic AMP phosphodiesterase CpdA
MPSNGPSKAFDSRTYYLDYQGVRFISLDSPALGYCSSDMKMILEWLTTVLESNPNKCGVVFTHYPIFSCSQGRDSESYRDAVKPILEKYGVDLVLQGHDHTYCRGQNITGKTDKKTNMPIYILSVAGPKMYGINSSLWADRVATSTQLYQNISVSGHELIFKSFTATGDLYDGFRIIKNKKGINSITELREIKNIDERLSIPENRRSDIKPEEIQKIESRIKLK